MSKPIHDMTHEECLQQLALVKELYIKNIGSTAAECAAPAYLPTYMYDIICSAVLAGEFQTAQQMVALLMQTKVTADQPDSQTLN